MAQPSQIPNPPNYEDFDPELIRAFENFGLAENKLDINVTVEGNISSGKTSFLEHFKSFSNFEIIPENLKLWENFRGYNVLALKNERATYLNNLIFQMIANLSRLQQMNTVFDHNSVKIMERSIHSSYHVFVKNSHDDLGLGQLTTEALQYNYEVLTQGHLKKFCDPDLLVYVKTTPEVCFTRMKNRSRPSENNLTLEYLQQLHRKHENWIKVDEQGNLPELRCTLITVNGNLTPEQLKVEAKRVLQEILRIGREKILLQKLNNMGCENQVM